MRKTILVALAAAAVTLGTALPTSAAVTQGTTTTFSVTGGELSITAPASKDLGSGAPGSSTISTTLGNVSVSDTRAAVVGDWTASVSSTDFAHQTITGQTISNARVDYSPGTASASSGMPSPGAGGTLGSSRTAFFRVGIGNSSATWNPTLTVNVPAQAVAGTYSGTVTHSVS